MAWRETGEQCSCKLICSLYKASDESSAQGTEEYHRGTCSRFKDAKEFLNIRLDFVPHDPN